MTQFRARDLSRDLQASAGVAGQYSAGDSSRADVPEVGFADVGSIRRYAQDAVEHNPLNPQG